MVVALVAVTNVAKAHGAGHVLQFAIAVGSAGKTVEWVVADVQLHHSATQALEFWRLCFNRHARRNRRGARGWRALASVYFDQAQTARAKWVEAFSSTQFWHVHAAQCRCAHHAGAFFYGDCLSVDGEFDRLQNLVARSCARARCAEIVIHQCHFLAPTVR